jgi:heme oxygenase
LEGSALGGQILSRQLQSHAANWPETIPLPAATPIDSYFVGRGEMTGCAWRDFCQSLNREVTQAAAEVAATAAVKTFQHFYNSLTGKTVCAPRLG